MRYRLRTPLDYVRLLLNACLIIIGLLILFGIITLPVVDIWLAVILFFAGVIICASPNPALRITGFIILLAGLYLTLRSADIISVPVMGYLLGGLSILVGSVNLVRGASGGSTTKKQST